MSEKLENELSSGHMAFIQRRIYVDANSTLCKCHVSAGMVCGKLKVLYVEMVGAICGKL